MSSTIAALSPSNQPIQRKPDYDGAPDVPEISFSELWQDKGEGFSFGDFLDIINPLQHIPVVSTIYRMVTEDEIGPGARVVGGALFGGPLGVLGAGVAAVFEETSGASVEQHLSALWENITGDDAPSAQIASATTASPSAGITAQHTALPQDNDILAYTDDVDPPAPVISNVGAAIAAQTASPGAVQQIVAVPPSPQPVPRPPVGVAPLTAVHRTQAAAAEAAQPDSAAETRRIAQSIDRARQAQAGLLLANVGAENPSSKTEPDPSGAVTSSAADQIHQPFRSHPYLLPRGAPPEMVSRAMEQALAKYQATLQQRNQPTPIVAPITPPNTPR